MNIYLVRRLGLNISGKGENLYSKMTFRNPIEVLRASLFQPWHSLSIRPHWKRCGCRWTSNDRGDLLLATLWGWFKQFNTRSSFSTRCLHLRSGSREEIAHSTLIHVFSSSVAVKTFAILESPKDDRSPDCVPSFRFRRSGIQPEATHSYQVSAHGAGRTLKGDPPHWGKVGAYVLCLSVSIYFYLLYLFKNLISTF